MPATSRAQANFMAMCEHDPQHAKGQCPDMTRAQMHDYAATPRRGLPAHVTPAARDHTGGRVLQRLATEG